MPKKLFIQAFVLLCLIAISHIVAIKLYVYWTVWWFDIILHFLGGVCVSMGAISVWQYVFNNKYLSKKRTLFVGIFSVVVIGILWEVFELHFDLTLLSDGNEYWFDTISDLILDITGGIMGAMYAYKLDDRSKI